MNPEPVRVAYVIKSSNVSEGVHPISVYGRIFLREHQEIFSMLFALLVLWDIQAGLYQSGLTSVSSHFHGVLGLPFV